jgi:hypothetical protein
VASSGRSERPAPSAAAWGRQIGDHLRLMQPQPIEVDQIDVGPETRCNMGTVGEAEEIGGLAGLPFAKCDTADRDRARRAISRATHVRVAPRRGRAGKSASCRPSPALAKFQVTAEMDWDGE